MLSVSTLTTVRSFRLSVAILVSLVFFQALYVWKPLNWILPVASTERTQSANDVDSVSHISPNAVGTGELKPHSFNINTAIPHIPDKVWHSAKK